LRAKLFSCIILLMLLSCKKQQSRPIVPPTDPVPAPVVQDGLVAYYPFNGNVKDESGHSLDGSIVGNASFGTDRGGDKGRSLQLNGDLSYVKVNDDIKLQFKKKMTLYVEFFPETAYSYMLLGKREIQGGGLQSWRLAINFVTPVALGIVKGGRCSTHNVESDWFNTFSDPAYRVNVNQWNCIFAVFDGSTQTIYLNGQEVSKQTTDFSEMATCEQTSLQIGYWCDSLPYSFKGRLDEVRIYDRLLTADERNKLCQGTIK